MKKTLNAIALVADLTPGAFLIVAGVVVTIVGILWR